MIDDALHQVFERCGQHERLSLFCWSFSFGGWSFFGYGFCRWSFFGSRCFFSNRSLFSRSVSNYLGSGFSRSFSCCL
jgi:hypothetical protein